jgi:hypothetical protein
MRTVLEKEFKKDDVLGGNDIRRISKHAAQLSNTCASLELDDRRKGGMRSVKGSDSWSPINKYLWFTDMDGRTFYNNACGDLFKNLSEKRLAEIVEKTKN